MSQHKLPWKRGEGTASERGDTKTREETLERNSESKSHLKEKLRIESKPLHRQKNPACGGEEEIENETSRLV